MIGANPDDVMLLSSAQSTKLPLPSLPPLPWQHCQLRVRSMAPSASSDEGTRTPKKWTFHDLKGMLVVSSSTLKLPGLYRHTDCIFIRIISLAHAPEKKEAGRPPECSFLLIYEIEISQVITSFHHHIKTKNLTIYFNALFPEVNLFHLNQLAFII